MKRTLSLTFITTLALTAAVALGALVAIAPHAALAWVGHAFETSLDAASVLMAAGPLMAFKVRDGFVSTVFNKAEINGREEVRQMDSYGGELVKYDTDQAILNLHKLEPADKAATEFVNGRHAIAEQPLSPASVAEQVATAVADALAAFKAGLIAAGMLDSSAAPAAPAGAVKAAG